GGPVEASESQVLDRRAIRRWLPRVGVTLALLVVTPTCAVEAAYRIELLNVPRPVRPRRELAKMAAEALSLDLTGSPVAEIRPIWPWPVAGFLPDAKVSRGLVRRTPGSVAAHGRYPAHHRVRSGGRGSPSPACASVDHTRLRCCRWPLIGPPGFAVECRGTFRRPRHAEFHWRS